MHVIEAQYEVISTFGGYLNNLVSLILLYQLGCCLIDIRYSMIVSLTTRTSVA